MEAVNTKKLIYRLLLFIFLKYCELTSFNIIVHMILNLNRPGQNDAASIIWLLYAGISWLIAFVLQLQIADGGNGILNELYLFYRKYSFADSCQTIFYLLYPFNMSIIVYRNIAFSDDLYDYGPFILGLLKWNLIIGFIVQTIIMLFTIIARAKNEQEGIDDEQH